MQNRIANAKRTMATQLTAHTHTRTHTHTHTHTTHVFKAETQA